MSVYDLRREVVTLQPRFRVLHDWTIHCASKRQSEQERSFDCVSFHSGRKREATIYYSQVDAHLYILHELLHICFAELQLVKAELKRETEEFIIQDVCALVG